MAAASDVCADTEGFLSAKELKISTFLKSKADSLVAQINVNAFNTDEAADLMIKRLLQKAELLLQDLPLIFQYKWQPILKQYILKQYQLSAVKRFVTIDVPMEDGKNYALKYKQIMQVLFYNSPNDISFNTTNKSLAGQIPLHELFLLHFYAFACCVRVRHDLLFALAVTGKSSSVKSTAFECPILSTCYTYCSQTGCGRFKCDNANLVLCHDILLSALVSVSDGELFRCLARGEICKSKQFATETTLEPLFLLITSNQNVHRHVFSATPTTLPAIYPAQLVPSKRNAQQHEVYAAMQARILEMFFRNRPTIPLDSLPSSGNIFERIHLVLGLFDFILTILLKTPIQHFTSHLLFQYNLQALYHNFDFYCHIFACSESKKSTIKQALDTCNQKLIDLKQRS